LLPAGQIIDSGLRQASGMAGAGVLQDGVRMRECEEA
jgi:hypothetical protein